MHACARYPAVHVYTIYYDSIVVHIIHVACVCVYTYYNEMAGIQLISIPMSTIWNKNNFNTSLFIK